MIQALRAIGLEVADDIVRKMIQVNMRVVLKLVGCSSPSPLRHQEHDTNGDGLISFREFLNMMWLLQTGPATSPAAAASAVAAPLAAPQPTHIFAWGPADVYTIFNLASKEFITVLGAGPAAGPAAPDGSVVFAGADAVQPTVAFRIHCRKGAREDAHTCSCYPRGTPASFLAPSAAADELMLQCYHNGLFVTASKDGAGVVGTREPAPGHSMWRFKRLGGSKFTLQSVTHGTFLEAVVAAADGGATAAAAAGGAPAPSVRLLLVPIHGSPRVAPELKWRINEAAPLSAGGKK